MNRQSFQIITTISLGIAGLLLLLMGLARPALAADQCAAPGGAGGCFTTI